MLSITFDKRACRFLREGGTLGEVELALRQSQNSLALQAFHIWGILRHVVCQILVPSRRRCDLTVAKPQPCRPAPELATAESLTYSAR